MDRDTNTETIPAEPARPNIRDDVGGRERPTDSTGSVEDSPGMPGGTLGTGGAREEDQ